MNLRKIFATLILCSAALGAFACQYTHYMYANVSGKRCLYLSGINVPGNHISGLTSSNYYVDSNVSASYDAHDHLVVSLPLTVYVGVADLNTHGVDTVSNSGYYGAEMQGITLSIQYRVLPSTTWHTALPKKFSAGNLNLITKQKLFGSFQIDADAPAGSTVIVRMYMTVDRYYDISGSLINGPTDYWEYIENADQESDSVSSVENIPANKSYDFLLMSTLVQTHDLPEDYILHGDGNETPTQTTPRQETLVTQRNCIFAGLHFCNTYKNNAIAVPSTAGYVDGWSPQFVMIVKIGSKRRPGK